MILDKLAKLDKLRVIRAIVAAGAAAGMLCSRKLWVSSGRLYPPIPLFEWTSSPPYPADYVLFGLTLAALAGIAIAPRPRVFLITFLGLAALLFLLDQSRLQPWWLEYAAISGALVAGSLASCRLFFICMYFYSGVQKLNYGFAVILASMLQPIVVDRLHWSAAWLGPRTLVPVGILLGLIEGASGLLLAFPRTRRIGCILLIGMHLMLLAWLGPLGLNQNRVIWPWNVVQILLLLVLFAGRDKWDLPALWRRHWYAKAVAIAFGVLPLLSLAGAWDSYLGFSFYSGHTKEAMLYVDPKRHQGLPPGLRPYLKADGILDLHRWSTEELGVPVYPETRIFTALGRQVALWLNRSDSVRVIQMQRADWLTGRRQSTSYDPLTY